MKVKAKKLLFCNNRRYRPGEEFILVHRRGKDADGQPIELSPEKQFSEHSMEKVDAPKKSTRSEP